MYEVVGNQCVVPTGLRNWKHSYRVYNKTLKLFAFVFKEQMLASPPISCHHKLVGEGTDDTKRQRAHLFWALDATRALIPSTSRARRQTDAAVEPDSAWAVWSSNLLSCSRRLIQLEWHWLCFDCPLEGRRAEKSTTFLFSWPRSPPFAQFGPSLALKGRLRWLMCS